jgi:hypothetical protein
VRDVSDGGGGIERVFCGIEGSTDEAKAWGMICAHKD